MNDVDLLTKSYDYTLPTERIATHPVYPRDSAKLLVYERARDRVTHTHFKNLLEYLPECDVFLNDTKVIKARLFGKKETGGAVELLFVKALDAYRMSVMIRGKVREKSRLLFDKGLTATVEALQADGSRTVVFTQNGTPLRFETLVSIMDEIGHIPLPPYIDRNDTAQDETDYQTLFARKEGAVAAPTASLHFTPELLKRLEASHATHTLTLHVGAGTFKPVEADTITHHPMHSEYFHIPNEAAEILRSDRQVLAVGTTVTRTIEYFARTGKTEGECDLFLHPHNPPIRVSHLLTNFHLPKSTLIMLVSAFIGREKTLALYQEAIEKKYRFYSYGDAMLIL